MNNRKKCKASVRNSLTVLLICLIAVSIPVSVLAYDPVYVYHNDVYYPDSDMCITFDGQSSPFETLDTSYLDFSVVDEIIIDEDGNQYPVIADEAQTARACVHEYISGQRTQHVKNGSGCTIYIYEGTYCKNCKICVHETLIGQNTLITCPH